MGNRLRIVLADDHTILREGLRALLTEAVHLGLSEDEVRRAFLDALGDFHFAGGSAPGRKETA